MKKIEILWHDAYTHDSWESRGDVIETCKPMMLCKSVGWVLDETKKHITICHTYNPQMVMGTLHIPKGCIKKIKRL